MTDPIELDYFLNCIKNIRRSLDSIEEDLKEDKAFIDKHNIKKPITAVGTMELLCRVGALDSALATNFDLKIDPNAPYRRNTLCHCYDSSNYDEFEDMAQEDLKPVWLATETTYYDYDSSSHTDIIGIYESEGLARFDNQNKEGLSVQEFGIQTKQDIIKRIDLIANENEYACKKCGSKCNFEENTEEYVCKRCGYCNKG